MSTRQSVRSGFTLIELLTVMAIIVTLASLATMAVTSMTQSSSLTQAGGVVQASLSQARQEAVARSCEVQVRFFQLPTTQDGSAEWNALQIWYVRETVGGAVEAPASKLLRLPATVAISGDVTLSPILTADATLAGKIDVSEFSQVDFAGFRIRADGSLDESVTGAENYLLLHRSGIQATSSTLPDNFVAFQINPLTGAVQEYRP